jgi:hypothetical protein
VNGLFGSISVYGCRVLKSVAGHITQNEPKMREMEKWGDGRIRER